MNSSRRTFLKAIAGGGALALTRRASAQAVLKSVRTPVLEIAYEESGNPQGFPIILLHGFPDDVRAWDGVVPTPAARGNRVLVPYLRGFGPTRFPEAKAPRTGEQAAIGQDLIDLADTLHVDKFAVAGFDWGGRAASVAAALHPERIRGAVIVGGYLIQDVFAPPAPLAPEIERAYWYQWYFNTERGRAGLKANRRELCRLLWRLWSPGTRFTDEQYSRTAKSFDNPDFVDVVIHSYRHRHGNAPGEPRFEADERKLAQHPKISAPTIILHGADDGIQKPPADSPSERAMFTNLVDRRVIAGAGHFLPREKADAVSTAIDNLIGGDRL